MADEERALLEEPSTSPRPLLVAGTVVVVISYGIAGVNFVIWGLTGNLVTFWSLLAFWLLNAILIACYLEQWCLEVRRE